MNITIIGTGFVGVVSAAVYASFGHQVIGLDVNEKTVASLQANKVPFFEPNLENLLQKQQNSGRLSFTTDYESAIKDADIIMIAVGTPSAPDGQADLKYVFACSESLSPHIKDEAIIAIKSTVPPGTLDSIEKIISKNTNTSFYTASVPEFLREGSAVNDTLNPDRVVIGATDELVFQKLEQLHKPLQTTIVRVKPESAQMAKYAANSYLATRITFINQIADLCEINGADIQDIITAIGFDNRIGGHYWYPGLGYGGSCFPKDVKELAAYSRAVGESDNLLNKVSELNEKRIVKLLNQFGKKVGGWDKKKVAILGLSFKPNTDDMREAPATKIIPLLEEQGAQITTYDPMAKWDKAAQAETITDACSNADVIFSVVEWPQIISFDYGSIKKDKPQWFIDARNQFNPIQVKNWGYTYIGIGRPVY